MLTKIVSATVVGRIEFLKIQAKYLLKHHIKNQKHYWLMNIYNEQTEQWCKDITAQYPDLFEMMYLPSSIEKHQWPGFNVGSFFNMMDVSKDALYVKIDDDVVYLSDDFFQTLLNEKNKHPDYLVICPYIVNNQAHLHIAQRHNKLPSYWKYIHNKTWCYTGEDAHRLEYLHDVTYGEAVHNYFIKTGPQFWLNWRKYPWVFDQTDRFSINCIAFSGEDFLTIKPIPCDDEEYLSRTVAKTLNRHNAMFTSCMCVHFSFYTQKGYFMERGILDKYLELSTEIE